jgi:predicted amidophosphoribosyltransferase
MGHPDYRNCKNCGRHASECGPLSWTRLCEDCGRELLHENIDGIHDRQGRAWARWRIGMVSSVLRNPQLVNALIDAGAFSYSSATTDSKGSR